MNIRKLLPDEIRSPWLFMAIHVLPQIVLSLILWRAWDLVSAEVAATGRGAYLTVLGMQIVIVLTAIIVGVVLMRRAALIRWQVGLAFIVLNILFLWAGFALCKDLVPRTVAEWMLSPMHLIFAFLCLVCPALFYDSLCVVGISLPISLAKDLGGSVAILVLIPTGWYIFAVIYSRFYSIVHIPFAVGMTIFIVCTAMVVFVFLRLLMWLYRVARGTFIPALLGGLVLPLCGLALNVAIPFPVNLQYWPVYVLTVVNGIVLLLPFNMMHPVRQWVWFARIVMYPFSLYFFILFLPFLPLSILAMIAAGAGFLILTPVFLFVVHSRMIFDETRMLARFVSREKILKLFIVAIALLPMGYVVRATIHRTALMRAVEAVYTPDLAVEQPAISPSVTKVALKRLQSMKDGLYLPFMSEIYNRIVFNGMVLPDYKVKRISEDICGEDFSQRPNFRGRWSGGGFFNIFLNTRSRSMSWANTRPPPRNVALKDVRITSIVTNGPLVEVRIELELQNSSQDMAEYVGEINVPSLVAVSGFELDMKGEWVEGRVADRKSALWLYHMIRDSTRRDPGVLVYTDPQHLKLSVFPFTPLELRRCAIRFVFLTGITAEIVVADQRFQLGGSEGVEMPIVQVALNGGGKALYVPREQAVSMPSVQRAVCVHFLLDVSASAVEAMPLYAKRVEEFFQRHLWVTNTAATAVNFGSKSICPAGTSPDKLREEVSRAMSQIKACGGYSPDMAVRRILFKELTSSTPSPCATLFVFVSASNAVPVNGINDFLGMMPDVSGIDVGKTVETPSAHVVQFNAGNSWALLSAESGGWVFNNEIADNNISFKVLAGSNETVITPGLQISVDSRWAAVAAIRKLSFLRILYPYRADMLRDEILSIAKKSGILAPETAYTVVETSAQWKTLERAEKMALGAHSALEFDEFQTPEPEVWIILAGFAVWLVVMRVVARRHVV